MEGMENHVEKLLSVGKWGGIFFYHFILRISAFCYVVYGNEAKCAIAAAKCVPQHSSLINSNSTCEELGPLGNCLVGGGCESSDFTYQAQAKAYGLTGCTFNGAEAVFISFSLVVAMVSLAQFLTR
ncbi:hypothetical protein LOTGIDRAFT_228222 [Lottia gigantea]|uniref:Uncharacterized protein n=1 Tax=Lottia gigantea TaxID=225164 RepID=V4A176_LOTGI|nr:hypothetical protein LOTGIDRAFT_228222 [Lottia gigantea]ESO97573.1 hypothetical protein LOTGIDRAFT_228222 [Lottia gigantea]